MEDEYFIKVDGTELPCPSSFTWGLQDVSASQSGRTDDAIMHKNRVAQKGNYQSDGMAQILKQHIKL